MASSPPTPSRSIYQKFREVDLLDKKKTVTALKPGEDRAILLGLGMILSSVMLYFVLGITILRSYAERYGPQSSFSTLASLNRFSFKMSTQRVDGGGRVRGAQRHGHGGRELLLQLWLRLLESLQVPLPAGLREPQQHGPGQPLVPQRGDAGQQL